MSILRDLGLEQDSRFERSRVVVSFGFLATCAEILVALVKVLSLPRTHSVHLCWALVICAKTRVSGPRREYELRVVLNVCVDSSANRSIVTLHKIIVVPIFVAPLNRIEFLLTHAR